MKPQTATELVAELDDLERRNPDYRQLECEAERNFRRGFLFGYQQAMDELCDTVQTCRGDKFMEGALRRWCNAEIEYDKIGDPEYNAPDMEDV